MNKIIGKVSGYKNHEGTSSVSIQILHRFLANFEINAWCFHAL